MTIYVSGRQSGKTTFLIRQSADTGAVIVAPTCQMARYIDSMARDLGLQIPPPDTPWIEPVELKCTYFRQDTGTIR